jgi:hypothetical protein
MFNCYHICDVIFKSTCSEIKNMYMFVLAGLLGGAALGYGAKKMLGGFGKFGMGRSGSWSSFDSFGSGGSCGSFGSFD